MTDSFEYGLALIPVEPTWAMQIAGRDAILAEDPDLDLSTDDARACFKAMADYAAKLITRDRLAIWLASLDSITLKEIKSTVGPAADASAWREYLGRADDLLAMISAEVSR
ncbi:hypothetical protein GCM10008171_32440 [Methylopila jiangsuensis]|uniref:Uncharacterized protein n=1 Tax=Methylopila jiangsuensis TaxID=586230 RepID=A0A9W6JLG2_9HYPH|nr:hypothetical protein [Methylopila jiangsuensis]MDR6284621.1 hypothetical protein [Methylopila jiangsuensis]GLK77990.1 hypothetical protein GCM10008171_32440 [Methylopila jiangsuensis]